MADRMDSLTEDVQGIKGTLHDLSKKVDHLSVSVDERFNAVDRRFGDVDEAIREQREYTEFAFTRLESQILTKMDERFGRIDRKLDVVIDARPAWRRPKRGR